MDEYNRMACKHDSAIIDTAVRYPPYLTFPKTESADASTMNRALDKLVEDLKSEQVDIQIIKHPTNTIISLESVDNHCQRTRLLTLFAASRLKAAALHTPSLLGDVYGPPTWLKGGQTLKKTELIPGDGTLHMWGARFTGLNAQNDPRVLKSLQCDENGFHADHRDTEGTSQHQLTLNLHSTEHVSYYGITQGYVHKLQ